MTIITSLIALYLPFFQTILKWNISFPSQECIKKKMEWGLKWYWGRSETTPMSTEKDPSNPEIVYNAPNNKNLDPFFQIDFSTTYKWESLKRIQYKLGLSVLNVLNRKNKNK